MEHDAGKHANERKAPAAREVPTADSPPTNALRVPQNLLSVQRTAGNRAATSLALPQRRPVQRLASPLASGVGPATTGATAARQPIRHERVDGTAPQVQRVAPPLIAGIGAAIKALTLTEALTVVGTLVGAGITAGGMMAEPHNDRSGVGPDAFLSAGQSDYLTSRNGKEALAQILRIYYFSEMETIIKREQDAGNEVDDAKQSEFKETALGNVKMHLTGLLSRLNKTTTETWVANGDGGRSKGYVPWGSVTVEMTGGTMWFDYEFKKVATRHHVTIPTAPIYFISDVKLSLDHKKDENVFSNDDIWVRVMSINATEDKSHHVAVHAEVAFDWDGDTTRYEWGSNNPLQPGYLMGPRWRGAADPDD